MSSERLAAFVGDIVFLWDPEPHEFVRFVVWFMVLDGPPRGMTHEDWKDGAGSSDKSFRGMTAVRWEDTHRYFGHG